MGVGRDERHRDPLAPGDLALIYLATPGVFIGRAELATAVHDWTPSEAEAYPGDSPSGVLLFHVEAWDPAVPMDAVVSRIDPTASNPLVQANAAAGFRTGVVRITGDEYEAALSAARLGGHSHRSRFARLVRGYQETRMASYTVNRRGVAQARRLIKAKRYVLNSNWGDVQPKASDENAFLKEHPWPEYAGWFLGLTEGAAEETKARCAFVYGDFRRLHRSGLIACLYRAAEWRHKEVERAAYKLLQELDAATA